MKKLIIISMLLGLGLVSCSDYLDLNPTDQLSSETFWNSKTDFEQALTASYGSLQSPFFSYSIPNWDNLTDNGYGQHAEGQYGLTTELAQGNIDPNTGGFVSGVYSDAYRGIARVNNLLFHLEDFEDIDFREKNIMQAEARMIRAFYYSYLYRAYGAVPLVSEPLDLETQVQPKSPIDIVYQFMMIDLDFGINNLRDETYRGAPGRWTVDAAKAYKARMLLYEAYDDAGNAIPEVMAEANTLLKEIKGYSLANDFSDNFHDLEQDNSPEIMMSVKFLAPDNASPADMWYGDWVVVSPLANLIDEFEKLDGSPAPKAPYTGKGVLDLTKIHNDDFVNRDPRLAKTIYIDGFYHNGNLHFPSNARPIGSGLSKFLSPNLEVPYTGSTKSQQDWVLLRYADVLLMLAETENEISGPSEAAPYVNEVRNRVGMPNLPTGISKDEMRKRIRHERRVELAFEGIHYFDLKRWKVAEEVMNNVEDGIITYNFEPKHYLWPLPQSEIDKSNGILEQNPDY